MGVFEMVKFMLKEQLVCVSIANYRWQDSLSEAEILPASSYGTRFRRSIHHILLSGGALSLEYLEGKELPGVASISEKDNFLSRERKVIFYA